MDCRKELAISETKALARITTASKVVLAGTASGPLLNVQMRQKTHRIAVMVAPKLYDEIVA